jgi:hypothetical protein
MTDILSRRLFLSMSAAIGVATPVLAANGQATAPMRMHTAQPADGAQGGIFGALYAVMPDRAPLHLADFEMQGAYVLFRERMSGARLETFTNPLTGTTRRVETSIPRGLPAEALCETAVAAQDAPLFAVSIASREIMFAATAITPYMPWLGMGDLPGFALWHAQGRTASTSPLA